MRWLLRAVSSLVLLMSALCAGAQTYPNKPIRLVVPYPPGGGTDLLARTVGQKLAGALGQPVIVENKPGTGTIIRVEAVAKCAPDGYTLLMATSTTLAINPSVYRKLSYDPVKDFVPVAMVASVPFVLIVNSSVPARNVAELVSMMRAKPSTYAYASAGNGTMYHLAAELSLLRTVRSLENNDCSTPRQPIGHLEQGMELTGGQALVSTLIQNDVKEIFFIPGIQLDWAVEALRQNTGAIRRFVPRHEQSTTYMADGYYRASGKPGVAMVVPGPGVLNSGAGLATAYGSNSKLLFLAGHIHSSAIGQGYGQLHEIKDQTGVIAGLTKWNARVRVRSEIGPTLQAAFAAMHEGRPRPVGVELPYDLLIQKQEEPAPAMAAAHPPVQQPQTTDIHKAAVLLNAARFPVLYVGGGVLAAGAAVQLQRLAEKMGAPVVMSDNGLGAMSERHVLAMNALAGRPLFEAADVVVVIGSRFMDAMTPSPSWPAEHIQYIYINVDPADLSAPRQAAVAIQADAAAAIDALAQAVDQRVVLSAQEALKVKAWAQVQIDAVSPQASFIRAMRAALPEDGIFVNELTQVGYLSRVAFPVYQPRTYIGPGYQGTLGYGFPTALGAAVGAGGKRVLAITGDGGFGWSYQELATARKYKLPVTLVVFNDGHFGNVRAIQRRVFGAEVAVDLENPDFALLARAFGVPSSCVTTPEALGAAIRASLSEPGPVLIEVPVGEMPSPWHLLRLQPMAGLKLPDAPPHPLPARKRP